jgi:multisubunit Na+/H+ antiporter MnhB subunit
MNTRIAVISIFLLIPTVGLAQANLIPQYVPLAGDIPGITDTDSTPTLIGYLNAIFTLTISVGAMLAVIRIALAGFQYLSTDAWGSKEEALGTIRAVLIGLIVLLLSTVILRTINPDLLNLDILSLS